MDVVLQAGAGMVAAEVDFATGNEEGAVDELDDAIGEITGEIGAVVGGAIFAQAAGDEDFGKAVAEREFDVGVSLVVAQQDVVARLALLDEIVFQSQRLVLVGDEDVIEVHGLAHERAGLGVGLAGGEQVAADARTKIPRLADVDHLTLGVLVEVNAGLGGKRADFLVEVHGRRPGRAVSS